MVTDGGCVSHAGERIIIPLDVSTEEQAAPLIQKLAPYHCWFKLGLEMIMSSLQLNKQLVWGCLNLIHALEGKVFLDGKFCDIPNTVGGAAANAAALGVDAFNLHASAGVAAMRAAVANRGSAQAWAVTALTSLTADDFDQLGFIQHPGGGLPEDDAPMPFAMSADTTYIERLVLSMANRAEECGCQGVICSGRELSILEGVNLIKVTPGIRPEWAAAQDQKRVMTPREAIAAGADLLVIGRPITAAANPVMALLQCIEEIELGLEDRRRAATEQGGGA
jgi:orotidine-5'-phosphate decarboxylase